MMEWSTRAADDIFLISDAGELRRHLSSSTYEMPIYIPSRGISPEEILELISTLQPRLVIVDLSFHGETGSQLIRKITTRRSSPLILAVSPTHTEQSARARRALIAGATGYLTQEELSDQLEQAVQRMTAGEIFLSDETKEMLHRSVYA